MRAPYKEMTGGGAMVCNHCRTRQREAGWQQPPVWYTSTVDRGEVGVGGKNRRQFSKRRQKCEWALRADEEMGLRQPSPSR